MTQDCEFEAKLAISYLLVTMTVEASVTKTIDVAQGDGSADYTLDAVYLVRIIDIETESPLVVAPFDEQNLASLALEMLIARTCHVAIEQELIDRDNTDLF